VDWNRLARKKRFWLGGILAALVCGMGLSWYLHAGPSVLVVHAIESWKDRTDLKRILGHRERLLRFAAEAKVDPYLLAGIMWAESRGVSGQTSSAGALGLMQLSRPAASDAARRLGLPEPTQDDLLHNDDLNVRLAAHHVRWLLDVRGDWTLEMVLVSYNAGRTKLKRWIEEAGGYPEWCASEEQAKREGRKTTGALAYARRTLQVAETLRSTSALDPGQAGESAQR